MRCNRIRGVGTFIVKLYYESRNSWLTKSDALVIFGISGDLAYKKIFPTLQALVRTNRLNVPVVGVSRTEWTTEQLVERARKSIEEHGGGVDPVAFPKLVSLLRYVCGEYSDPKTFTRLADAMGHAQRPLFYLAIPPSAFPDVVNHLAKAGCTRGGARVVVEKPFGRDLASARALNVTLRHAFPDEAIFRIDHLPRQGSGPEHPVFPVRQFVSWSPSGTASTWRACKSRWRRNSTWRAAAPSMRKRA